MDEELCRIVLKNAGINVPEKSTLQFSEEDSPGLCYSSLLQRYRISIVEENKEERLLYVILKSNPDQEHSPDSLFDKMFLCETKMYGKILTHFNELFTRTGKTIIWPRLYTILSENQIVMEDLKTYNYRTNVNEGGSSLEEATLAINSLAAFHAASLVAKSEEKINDQTLEPYFYCRSDESINSFFKNGLNILATSIRQSWGNSWSHLADKIFDLSNRIGEIFVKLHLETDDQFKVINHGDFWRANLMYQYDADSTPTSFKIVDFQLSHYGSIGWDLSYFLYLNPNLKLRYDHCNHLLSCYQSCLANFLKACGCSTPPLKLDEIKQELNRFILYGFLKCCTDLPYQICSAKGGIDAENLFKNNEETDKLKLKIYSNEKYVNILKTHIDYLEKNKIL